MALKSSNWLRSCNPAFIFQKYSQQARRIALKLNTSVYNRSDIYPADILREAIGGTVSAMHQVILATTLK